jgi:hypothetical protein
MDDSSKLQPTIHIWTDSKVEWLTIEDGLPNTPRNPGEATRDAPQRPPQRPAQKPPTA